MHINSMPDLVLRLIFSKLSFDDLVYVGRVCLLWKLYQLEINRKVGSLTLFLGGRSTHELITKSCFTLKYRELLLNDDGTRMYSSQYLPKRFRLTYKSLSLNCAIELFQIFPNITSLEIVIVNLDGSLYPVANLLSNWSTMLKSLKVYYFQDKSLASCNGESGIYHRAREEEFINLMMRINSMPLLEHLTLNWSSSVQPGYFTNFPAELTILSQLREFYFESPGHCNSVLDSLQRHALSNDNLMKIGLQFGFFDFRFPSFTENVFRRFPQLRSKFVYLPVNDHCSIALANPDQFRNILQSFSSLTYLRFTPRLDENIFAGALNFVGSLAQLVHLELVIPSNYLERPGQYHRFQNSVQISSVQILTISTTFKMTSPIFKSNNWKHLFPNVQVFELLISIPRDLNCFSLSKPELAKALSAYVDQWPKLKRLFTVEHNYRNFPHHISETQEWMVRRVNGYKIVISVEK